MDRVVRIGAAGGGILPGYNRPPQEETLDDGSGKEINRDGFGEITYPAERQEIRNLLRETISPAKRKGIRDV